MLISHYNDESTHAPLTFFAHMLQKLDTGKANGPDAISARMLKQTVSAIAPSVTELFNLHWSAPKGLESFSCSAHSKAAGAKSPSEFQPISLLSVLRIHSDLTQVEQDEQP